VVTADELEELLQDCPILYHMAEYGSWPSIQENGLLSTTALLDRFQISGQERISIEAERRSESIALEKQDIGRAVVRDQLPMDDKGLIRCLKDGLAPADWYRILNSKVFFWLTWERLQRLLNAGPYRLQEHDVLAVDARALVSAYARQVWFCPMNSGCTKPFPHPRGSTTFQRIAGYPYADWRSKRPRGERVVELAIDYAVPDIAKFTKRVLRMRGNDQLAVLFEA
jgi:hypothetical protein